MSVIRYELRINGIVQGVGFRPFVFRIAKENSLTGDISNREYGVLIHIQGENRNCERFFESIHKDAPSICHIFSMEKSIISLKFDENIFSIKESQGIKNQTFLSPDLGICLDCQRELMDTKNRRYNYPFINCTNCGPRFTIIKSIPYDRENTTMDFFSMCEQCKKEYIEPENRRFHAEPNACDNCGPSIKLHYCDNIFKNNTAIQMARRFLRHGKIIAVKGLGGYHLACLATNEQAVKRLRERKNRLQKPLAIMCRDIEQINRLCIVHDEEKMLLESPEKPIVLLQKKEFFHKHIAKSVCSKFSTAGVMLPYTPLHVLLTINAEPLVMTSGNLSEEPILFEDEKAFEHLKDIADGILTNNRDILRPCDDSVLQIIKKFFIDVRVDMSPCRFLVLIVNILFWLLAGNRKIHSA